MSSLNFVERECIFRHATPEHWVEFMKTYFGPMIRAHEVAGEKSDEYTTALVDLARRHLVPGARGMYVKSGYIEVIAVKA